jgi:hypothetical protein
MNNNFKTILATGAGVVLSLAFTEVNPVQAAAVTYDFKVDIKEGSLIGKTYTGFFSYDDESEPVGFGYGSDEFYLTDFNFNFDGRQYTLNDVNCEFCYLGENEPEATQPFWVGGVYEFGSDSLNISTKSDLESGFDFGLSIFDTSSPEFRYGNVSSGVGVFRGNVTYTQRPVPEPITLLGTGLALGFGTFFKYELSKKQRKEKQQA